MAAASELAVIRAALAAAGDVAYEWDLLTDRLAWFDGTGRPFGLDSPDGIATGDRFNQRIHPQDLPRRLETLSRLYQGDLGYDCHYRVRLANGEHRWHHDRGTAEISPTGRVVALRGTLRAVDGGAHAADSRLEYRANYDELTGHYNRSRLRESLDHVLYYAQRYDTHGAFIVIGIDKLTLLNQAFGYEIADSVIVEVGRRLDKSLRASDIVGRIGGDRFGVVLAQCPEADLAIAAEKILEAMRCEPFETAAGPVRVTVSIGGVSFPAAVRTAQDAMAKADIALERAEQSGRDRYWIYTYSEEQLKNHRRNIVIAEQVQRALREDRLVFAYQPVVDAQTLETAYYECLLRMVQPNGDIECAYSFMPVVEELGMIRAVDLRVLELAVRDLSESPAVRLALNVSGLTTTDRQWRRTAVAMLRNKPQIASRLVVEITETAGLEDMEECARFVRTLRQLGCTVALDDFGAGYTSFSHLKSLAVDMVKIDGSFVRGIAGNPDNLVFVRTLLDLARNFNLGSVAECVETEEEIRLLAREGVRYLQGNAVGEPRLGQPWLPARTEIAASPVIAKTG